MSTDSGKRSTVAPTEPPYMPESTLPALPDTIDTAIIGNIDGELGVEEIDDVDATIERPTDTRRIARRSLRSGCYLLRYTPVQRAGALQRVHYDGTLRVERQGPSAVTASGDLYTHQPLRIWPGSRPLDPIAAVAPGEPNPALGIPIFPRKNYRYYVRVTKILEGSTIVGSFTLGFELHRFNHQTKAWVQEGSFTAKMTWAPAPPGYPSASHYLSGDVKSAAGATVGHVTMGWISKYLRKATLEIDRVNTSEAPLDNGAGLGYEEIYAQVGWEVAVDESDSNLTEPSGEFWSDAEMHAEMLARRDAADLDREWRYHLVCVRRLDSTTRGIMYDAYGGDSNNIPREGAGLASHWTIPNTAEWGLVRGQRFGTAAAPYFRTAVHEIGHAMGLYHNPADNGFMHTTPDIAASAVSPVQFPNNILWSFAPDDQKRLRHLPDIWVRPGGISFGAAYTASPISPTDAVEEAEGLTLTVKPLLASVPIGAPVRIEFTITNETDQPLPIPANLTMKGGAIRGRVIGPAGTVRTFWPLVLCIEEEEIEALEPGASARESLTLLRGAEGALFGSPGPHRIIVDAQWSLGEATIVLSGEAPVMITAPVNEGHAEAALAVLSAPDALIILAIGGDLDEGVGAIHAALDNPILQPHFAYIEAKRLAKSFGEREADIDAAAEILSTDTVVSAREASKAVELLESDEAVAGSDRGQELIGALGSRAKGEPGGRKAKRGRKREAAAKASAKGR